MDTVTLTRAQVEELRAIIHNAESPLGNRLQDVSSRLYFALDGAGWTPAAGQEQAGAVAARSRSEELHEKTGMGWREAHELALDEVGIANNDVRAVIEDFSMLDLDGSVLLNADDLMAFTRHCFIYSPLAAPGAAIAAREQLRADLTAFVKKISRGEVRDHHLSSLEDEAANLYFRAVHP